MMNKETDKQKAENITFYRAARQNTGMSALDSGGAYGRHHEKGPVSPDDPMITWEDPLMSATISTPHLLNEYLEIDRSLQAAWEHWDELNGDELDYFESGRQFAEEMTGCSSSSLYNYVFRGRDNVYNVENDLSQVYIWEVYTMKDSMDDDWLFADESLTVIYLHNGCDVRGGYSLPVFCRKKGELVVPMDLSADYEITGSLGKSLKECRELSLDETWSNGWSSYPYGKLENDIEQWLCPGGKEASHVGLHKEGAVVEVQAVCRMAE